MSTMGVHLVCSNRPASATNRLTCTRVMCVRKIKYKTPLYGCEISMSGMSDWSIHPPWSSDSLSGLRNSPMVSATHWVGSVAQGYSAPEIGMSYWSIHPPWSSNSLGGLRSHPRGHRDSLDGNRLLRATQLLACLSCRRLVDATAVAGGRLLCAGPSLAPGSNHPPWSS